MVVISHHPDSVNNNMMDKLTSSMLITVSVMYHQVTFRFELIRLGSPPLEVLLGLSPLETVGRLACFLSELSATRCTNRCSVTR